MSLQTLYGSLRARDIQAEMLSVTSNSTPMVITDMKGDLDIKGRNKSIELSDVHGRLAVEAERCPVSLAESSGPVDLSDTQATITVAGHRQGPAVLKTRLCGVILRDTSTPLEVDSSEGTIVAQNCGTEIALKNRDGDIHILQSGDGASHIGASTVNGNLWIYLAERPGFHIRASATGGRIENPLPGLPGIEVALKGSTLVQTLEGSIGRGKNTLTLTCDQGNIRLVKGERFAPILKRLSGEPAQCLGCIERTSALRPD
jgi:DUF4097 and DUF4098 domain-containing protein YvlB